jgi:hypothetical protein
MIRGRMADDSFIFFLKAFHFVVKQGLKPLSFGNSLDATPAFPAFCALAGLLTLHWSWGVMVHQG